MRFPLLIALVLMLVGVAVAPAANGTKLDPGKPVLLGKRTKAGGCTLSPMPDRRCSPGAYATKLTQTVVCASGFHTGNYRGVPQSLKYDVEREYGMKAAKYGKTLEIDHIVSLELGGSNDIANLFPEKRDVSPGYKLKDKLENRLHRVVCIDRTMTLREAQKAIAENWETLYRKIYGVAPQ